MMIQRMTVKASNMSKEKAAARLKSHLKYLQYRQHNQEQEETKNRHFFNAHLDHINLCWIHQSIIHGQTGSVYYYSLLFSPTHDEPVNNWPQWTRAILADVEDRLEQTLDWYAIQHRATDHPHIHVVVLGTGKDRKTGQVRSVILRAQDFAYICERGRTHSEYRLQDIMTRIIQQLGQCDMMSSDVLL